MQFRRRLLDLISAWLVAAIGFTGKVLGQVPDSMRSSGGMVIGHVTDTTGRPVPAADIIIIRESDSLVMTVSRTDSQGIARLPRVPSGGPYAVLARRIGYQPVRTPGIRVGDGDTLTVSSVLRPQVVVLPEITAEGKVPRVLSRDGFLGIRLFKCLFLGIGAVAADARAFGCKQNANAHAARREAREVAGEVRRVTRRVQKAQRAGRRPDPTDAFLVLNTAKICNMEVPKRPPWPRPDPDVRCREIFNRIPRDTLARLGEALAAIEATESFEEERRRRREPWQRLLDSLQGSAKLPDR